MIQNLVSRFSQKLGVSELNYTDNVFLYKTIEVLYQ